MAVKSKTKSKASDKTRSAGGSKSRSLPVSNSRTTPARSNPRSIQTKPKSIVLSRPKDLTTPKAKKPVTTKVRVVNKILPARILNEARKTSKGLRLPQYNYMKPPGITHDFQVGDTVEVYCDHEKNRDRIRGWIRGVIVQVDNKLVAVQFRSNVFLTDGWMVPDRILWYPLNSDHMKPVPGKKSLKRERAIPDY